MVTKIRRDGNSWVITITITKADARKVHLEEGSLVDVDVDETTGTLRITPVVVRPRRDSDFVRVGREVIASHRGLRDRIAAHDRGESAPGR